MKGRTLFWLPIIALTVGLTLAGCGPPTPAMPTEIAVEEIEEEKPEDAAKPATTPSPVPTNAVLQHEAVVTAKALHVRGGPGVEYDKVGLVFEGDVLAVSACNQERDWLAVTMPDGTEGWVSAGYVDSETLLDEISVASEIPAPPMDTPTSAPEEPAPTPILEEPAAPPSVDDQIADIAKGEHGELPQPGETGSVEAGGLAEVTIINDTPDTLTILVGAPNSLETSIEPCPVCKHYSFVGPVFCPEEGRPRKTISLTPGVCKVVAEVDDPSVTPFYGEWTLEGDTAYFNCFYIVTRFRSE